MYDYIITSIFVVKFLVFLLLIFFSPSPFALSGLCEIPHLYYQTGVGPTWDQQDDQVLVKFGFTIQL